MASPPLTLDAAALLPRPFRVRRVRQELSDTWTLELVSAGEEPSGLPFRPGQFTMLYAFGVGESAISISGDPGRPAPLVHTVRAVGPVTRALCATPAGGTVGVRGPFGTAWPLPEAAGRDLVVVAGGLGLAPLRPVLHAVAASRRRFGRVSLLVGARLPEAVLYAGELDGWRRAGVEVHVTVDVAGPSWTGEVGLVTALLGRARFDARYALAFVCGPELMMRFAAGALQERGVAGHRISLSLERNMKCAVGVCGHCQLGPEFVCRDGPVFPYSRVERLLRLPEA